MGKEMQLNNDEFKIVMAFRHKAEIDALQAAVVRSIMLTTGNERLEPEQVRRLCSDVTALDALLTKCGFLPEFEVVGYDEEDTAREDGESEPGDDDADAEDKEA